MKIKFLVSIAGSTGVFAPGETTDWADKEDAQRLIDAGFAEKVTPKKATKQTAAAPKPKETAATE